MGSMNQTITTRAAISWFKSVKKGLGRGAMQDRSAGKHNLCAFIQTPVYAKTELADAYISSNIKKCTSCVKETM